MCRSAVKVISQPNPQFGHGNSDNPLSVLGQALFPAGSTNAPMEQLQQFYRLGVQAMSKAQSAGGETRSNSVSASTGLLPLCCDVDVNNVGLLVCVLFVNDDEETHFLLTVTI